MRPPWTKVEGNQPPPLASASERAAVGSPALDELGVKVEDVASLQGHGQEDQNIDGDDDERGRAQQTLRTAGLHWGGRGARRKNRHRRGAVRRCGETVDGDKSCAAHCGQSVALWLLASRSRPQRAHWLILVGFGGGLDGDLRGTLAGGKHHKQARRRSQHFLVAALVQAGGRYVSEPELATSSMFSEGLRASASGREPTCTVVISLRVVASKTATLLEQSCLHRACRYPRLPGAYGMISGEKTLTHLVRVRAHRRDRLRLVVGDEDLAAVGLHPQIHRRAAHVSSASTSAFLRLIEATCCEPEQPTMALVHRADDERIRDWHTCRVLRDLHGLCRRSGSRVRPRLATATNLPSCRYRCDAGLTAHGYVSNGAVRIEIKSRYRVRPALATQPRLPSRGHGDV